MNFFASYKTEMVTKRHQLVGPFVHRDASDVLNFDCLEFEIF